MNKGKLYGIGVGPGDPELLTLKAIRLLREADVIAAPDAGGEAQTALEIVRDHIAGKTVVNCPSPMTRSPEKLEEAWSENAAMICELLDQGKTVTFITLGDPSVYSTYMYLHKKVRNKGYDAEMVPGIPSFCAAAARTGRSLCEGNERLLIVPGGAEGIDTDLAYPANRVIMKSGKKLGMLLERMKGRNAALVSNCGMPGEKVFASLEEAENISGYFTIILERTEKTEN